MSAGIKQLTQSKQVQSILLLHRYRYVAEIHYLEIKMKDNLTLIDTILMQ